MAVNLRLQRWQKYAAIPLGFRTSLGYDIVQIKGGGWVQAKPKLIMSFPTMVIQNKNKARQSVPKSWS